MKQFGKTLNTIFGYCVYLSMLLGGISFLGFAAAFFMGPEQATAIAIFIQKTYFVWVIRLASITVAIGLLGMYFNGEQALSLATEKKEAEDEMAQIKNNQA